MTIGTRRVFRPRPDRHRPRQSAPGAWAGEHAVVSRQPAASSAVAGAPCRALFLPLGRRQQMIGKQAPWTRRSAERVAECDWLALRMNTDALAPAPEAWLHGRPWAMDEIERGRAARVQQA